MRLRFASYTMNAISVLKTPTSLTERRSFFELRNIFRYFNPKFKPIEALFKEFTFGTLREEEIHSLNTVMDTVIAPSIFAVPKGNGHTIFDRDDCDVQVGSFFFERQPDEATIPIECYSRSLAVEERNYNQHKVKGLK